METNRIDPRDFFPTEKQLSDSVDLNLEKERLNIESARVSLQLSKLYAVRLCIESRMVSEGGIGGGIEQKCEPSFAEDQIDYLRLKALEIVKGL